MGKTNDKGKVKKTVASTQERKKQLNKIYESGKIIECRVTKIEKEYDLIVDLGSGILGKIKREDISLVKNEQGLVPENIIVNKVGKNIKCKIIDIKHDEIYLSKKEIEVEARKWIQNNLKPGMVLNGRVRNIQQYGVFIELLEGVVGLLHIEDISVARTKHPSERFNLGDKVKVVVKDFDRDTGKIVLSHKELLGTWEENAEKYKEGSEVYGIARDREKNGIFVELTPNLVGLAEHKSGVEYGQKVKVYIKKIVTDKKKIKLVIID